MSHETVNAHHASFLQKSLAAVSNIGRANPTHVPDVSTRNPTSRIFKLNLSRLKTSSSSRLDPKAPHDTYNPLKLHSLIDVEGSTSLDDDDSIDSEQSSDVLRYPPDQYDDSENSAADLNPPSTAHASFPSTFRAPPGLNPPQPPRYPIIVSTARNGIFRPGVEPPTYWAPGGGCSVRIEPPPLMSFMPRPGTAPPPWWTPGGRAARLEQPILDQPICEPVCSPIACNTFPAPLQASESVGSFISEGDTFYTSLDQYESDGTISNSVSSASMAIQVDQNDEETPETPPSYKDYIHAQLERILDMDDTLLRDANLPGIYESEWATCPTPPPSPGPSRPAMRLTRKQSNALLNYLLLECGYDLNSLRHLEARFPVPKPEPAEEPVATELGIEVDDLQLSERAEHNIEQMIVELLEIVPPSPDTKSTTISRPVSPIAETLKRAIEGLLPAAEITSVEPSGSTARLDALTEEAPVAVPEGIAVVAPQAIQCLLPAADITAVEPSMSSAHLDAPVEDVPLAIPELIAVAPGPPQASPPLRRCYSLPEGWVFSKFTVIKTPSPPPSPSPPPKPKPKHKIYNIPEAAISSVESLPAPLQSGHAFLQNQKQLKAKVKTRAGNDAAAHAPEPTQVPGVPFTRSRTGESFRRPSMLSSIAETPAARWITKIAIKGKATGDRVRTLFKGRDLAWKDFIKVMKELGFSAEPLPDGNSMRFNPPDRRYPSVVFKRPITKVCPNNMLNTIRTKLAETYGWTPEEIVGVLGAEKLRK